MARYEAEQTNQLSLLKRQMLEKKRLIARMRAIKNIDQTSANIVRAYWNQVSKIIDGLEQVGAAKDFAADVAKDIEALQEVRASLETRRDQPETENQLALVRSLLAVLAVVLATTKKKAKELSDARFAWLFSVNPAKPKKTPWWKRKESKQKKTTSPTPGLRELFQPKAPEREVKKPERIKEDPTRKKEDS
jgi:hypothetical protein